MDFGRQTPKFRFEFCCGFWGGYFPPLFSKEKGPKKIHQKIPRKIHQEMCSEKFPSDFCRSLFLSLSRFQGLKFVAMSEPENYNFIPRATAERAILSRCQGPKFVEISEPEKLHFHAPSHSSAAEKRGLWEGVVQEPLRRALFCVFLCAEVIFSTEISFRIAPPMQAFSGKPPREKPQSAAAEFYTPH